MTVSSADLAAFPRKPLPKRFCNLDRLLQALKARGLIRRGRYHKRCQPILARAQKLEEFC